MHFGEKPFNVAVEKAVTKATFKKVKIPIKRSMKKFFRALCYCSYW